MQNEIASVFMKADGGLLTIPEFCDRYRLSRATLYRLWDRGEGPLVVKIGQRKLIRPEAAEKWVKAHEQTA